MVMDFEDYKSKLSSNRKTVLDLVERSSLPEVERALSKLWMHEKADKLFCHVLLLTALRRSHRSMSKLFIKQKYPIKISRKTGHFCTPMYYAVEMHDLRIFKGLWQEGASIFEKDANNKTALELAMIQEDDNIINFVLQEVLFSKNKRDVKPDREEDVALFHAACWVFDWKAMEMFISRNFSLNSRSGFEEDDWKGFTPVHFTVRRYRYTNTGDSMSKILTRDDADLFATDHRGRTPIHLAFKDNTYHLRRNESVLEEISCSNKKQYSDPKDDSGLSHFLTVCSVKFEDGNEAKHRNCVKYFIDNGVDLNSSISSEDANSPGFTALHLVVQNSCWAILNLLLENGADPNRTNKNGLTPLHLLYSRKETMPDERWERGLEKIVESFLQHGADAAAKDPEDRTPLHISFRSHHGSRPLDKSEKLLLANNEQGINHTDKDGLSYLHMACTGDDLEIVKNLVVNGAQVNLCVPSEAKGFCGSSALHFAAKWYRVNIAKFLLSHGADVNCITRWKTTPLHEACYHQFKQVPQTDGSENKNDEFIEWMPSLEDHIQTIELLIKHGAFVNAEDDSNSTPLVMNTHRDVLSHSHYYQKNVLKEKIAAELFARQKKVMDILLRHGADINATNNYSGSMLHYLCKDYADYPFCEKMIRISLEKGANVSAVCKSKGLSPLHVAVEESLKNKGGTSLIELLLERGADVNARSKDLSTPLHVATQSYRPPAIRATVLAKLLDHPYINVDARNNRGQTPLHVAMARRDFFSVKKLLKSGADINFTDSDGHSAIYAFLTSMEKDITSGSNAGWKREEDRKILRSVVSHVFISAKLNKFISLFVRRDYGALLKHFPQNDLTLMHSRINEELELLKSRKLDNYTSLYDILFKDCNAMAKHVLNDELRRVVSPGQSKSEFVYVGSFIKSQYATGCRRLVVLQSAKSALNFVLNPNLPDSCSEKILSFLSNENLKDLIESTSFPGTSRKRLFTDSTSSESSAKVPRLN